MAPYFSGKQYPDILILQALRYYFSYQVFLHCNTLNIKGDRYRLKDIPKAGMLTSLPEEETPTTTYTSQKVMKTGHSKSVKGDQSKLV